MTTNRITIRTALRGALAAAVLLLVWTPVGLLAQSGAPDATRCSANVPPPTATPEITAAEICWTIAVLAHDSLEGRGAGEAGESRAAAWIAERLRATGLEAPEEGYVQLFPFPARALRDPHAPASPHGDPGGETLESANVIGMVRGTDPELRDEAVVIGAHYDHLGRGGRGSLAPGERAIHNGADDNASGVAGLLEIAGRFADDPPARSLVFVAFGAEELGTLGSQWYVHHPVWPLDRTVAMVNLDMIGRLRERLTVQGTGTSPAWPPLLDALEEDPDAPPIERIPDGFGPSDHASFYGADIPVLAFFTGAHEAYHRPDDDTDTIHAPGTVAVTKLAADAVAEVACGDLPVPWAEAPRSQRRAARFDVGLGVIPDYGFAGRGLRLSAVRPDGPGAAAGLEAGDVIVRLAGRDVADIYVYTGVLSDLEAGEAVEAIVERDGETLTLRVVPEAR